MNYHSPIEFCSSNGDFFVLEQRVHSTNARNPFSTIFSIPSSFISTLKSSTISARCSTVSVKPGREKFTPRCNPVTGRYLICNIPKCLVVYRKEVGRRCFGWKVTQWAVHDLISKRCSIYLPLRPNETHCSLTLTGTERNSAHYEAVIRYYPWRFHHNHFKELIRVCDDDVQCVPLCMRCPTDVWSNSHDISLEGRQVVICSC